MSLTIVFIVNLTIRLTGGFGEGSASCSRKQSRFEVSALVSEMVPSSLLLSSGGVSNPRHRCGAPSSKRPRGQVGAAAAC